MWKPANQLPEHEGRYWVFTPENVDQAGVVDREADLAVLRYSKEHGWMSPYVDAPLASQWRNWMTHWTEFPVRLPHA